MFIIIILSTNYKTLQAHLNDFSGIVKFTIFNRIFSKFDRFVFFSKVKYALNMVKLTPELINQSMQYINPVRDYELDLRGSFMLFLSPNT